MVEFDNLPSGAQKNIISAMIKIAIGNEGKEINKLMSKICIDEDQKALLWRAVIDQLYSQRKEIGEGINHSLPIREEDFLDSQDETINSLIQIIQSLCDAKDVEGEKLNTSELYQKIEDNADSLSEDNYWNESIASLVKKIIQLFELYEDDNKDDTPTIVDEDEHVITTIGDIRNANAANTFEPEENISLTEWVKPFKNIDGKSYNEIRLHDQITEILSNPNKLDMTKKKQSDSSAENNDTSFISLILPRYGRRVEIEDLDRNFWTIAQIVDGMSNWIFETSPFSEILGKLIDETTQLWENVLYLWLQLALIQQKKSDETLPVITPIKMIQSEDLLRYESIPVAMAKRTEDNSFTIQIPKFKFMGNIKDLKEQEEPNSLLDLEESYAEQDLCYISKIKVNNYRSNFYNGEYFDAIYFSTLNGIYNNKYRKRKLSKFEIKEIYKKNDEEIDERPLVISTAFDCEPFDLEGENNEKVGRFSTKLLSGAYDNGKFYLGYPFSETNNYLYENKRRTMYCGIRAIPEIILKKKEDGSKTFQDFTIKIYDALNSIFIKSNSSYFDNSNDKLDEERLIGEYKLKKIEGNKILMEYKANKNLGIPKVVDDTLTLDNFSRYKLTEIEWKNVDFAYYLGNCISWHTKTARFSNVESIIEQQAILLKIGNFLPEGIKGEHIDYPVPAISMSSSIGGLASQFRGDFTFKGVPKYYNSKKVEEIEEQDTHNSNKLNRDENNSFGQSDGTPGKLSFFYFDWSTYLPSKDKPGELLNLSSQNINSLSDGLCFQTSLANHCKKAFSKDVTESFLYNQSIAAAKNFILKTRRISGHFYQFLYQKPCYFITFIGIAPRLNDTTGLIEQDVNAVCHYIKYLPHYSSLSKSESVMKNYQNFYNKVDAISDGIVIDEYNNEVGKFIESGFINQYDSFYDLDEFKDSLNDSSTPLYITDNKQKRLIIEHNINDEKSDCCKRVLINETQYEYIINFSKGFLANSYYYDLQAAKEEHKVQSLLRGEKDSQTQISEGTFLIENGLYQQQEDGAIRAYNKTSFYARKNNPTIQLKEANSKDTGLLTIKNPSYRQLPFINGTLINQEQLTISNLFGITNGDFKNCEFRFKGDNDQEKPTVPYDDNSVIDDENTPDWIILQNFSFGYNPIDASEVFKTAPDADVKYFPFMFIDKKKSDKKAYNDFYYNLKTIISNYALTGGAAYYTSKDYYIDIDEGGDFKETGDIYLKNINPNKGILNNSIYIKVDNNYISCYSKDENNNWQQYNYLQRGAWGINYVKGVMGNRVFKFNDEENQPEDESVLMICNEIFPSDPHGEVQSTKFIVVLTQYLDGEIQATILQKRLNSPDYNDAYDTLYIYKDRQTENTVLSTEINSGLKLINISNIEGEVYLCTDNITVRTIDDKTVWINNDKKYTISQIDYNLIKEEDGIVYLTQKKSPNRADQKIPDFIYYYPYNPEGDENNKIAEGPRIIAKKFSNYEVYMHLLENWKNTVIKIEYENGSPKESAGYKISESTPTISSSALGKSYSYTINVPLYNLFSPSNSPIINLPDSEQIKLENGGTSIEKNGNYPLPESSAPVALSKIEDNKLTYISGYIGLRSIIEDKELMNQNNLYYKFYYTYDIFQKNDDYSNSVKIYLLSYLKNENGDLCVFVVSPDNELYYQFAQQILTDAEGKREWSYYDTPLRNYEIKTSTPKLWSYIQKISFGSEITISPYYAFSNYINIPAKLDKEGYNFIISPQDNQEKYYTASNIFAGQY